jgi:hypothetical protein
MSKQEFPILSQRAETILPQGFIDELSSMIDQTRESIAVTVNAKLTMLYWHIGNRVRKEILNGERAEYGQEIVSTVSRQLMEYYGKGFSDKNLRRMIHFGEAFPDEQIVSTLLRQLSWSHFTLLLPIKDPLKRDFYAEMCRREMECSYPW